MNKKELAILFSKFENIKNPKVNLEQYTLPDELAAEIINIANLDGSIKNKIVFDLGCGNGKLGIGASYFEPKFVVCVDIDKNAIKIAKQNAKKFSKSKIFFVVCDVKNFFVKKIVKEQAVVIQNPPFGLKGERHKDVYFLKKACEIASIVYSLHRGGYKKTREFLTKKFLEFGFDVKKIVEFKFEIPQMFLFHKKKKVNIKVDLYIATKIK